MKRKLLLVGLALSDFLQAQPLPFGLSVDRNYVQIGQPVKVVVNFEGESRWCGLRVDLGDGDVRDILVGDSPLIFTKQYAAAGRYVLRTQGRSVAHGIQPALGCVVARQSTTVVVGERGIEASSSDDEGTKVGEKKREAQRERQKRDAEQARERGKREWEDRLEAPNRDQDVAPVPAPTPLRTAAPAQSKPRDGTLRVF